MSGGFLDGLGHLTGGVGALFGKAEGREVVQPLPGGGRGRGGGRGDGNACVGGSGSSAVGWGALVHQGGGRGVGAEGLALAWDGMRDGMVAVDGGGVWCGRGGRIKGEPASEGVGGRGTGGTVYNKGVEKQTVSCIMVKKNSKFS